MKVGFLFNHYAGHQVFHSAPVAFALSSKYPSAQVAILVSDKKQMDVLERIAKKWPNHTCAIIKAKVPFWARVLDKLIGKMVFVRKWAVLKANRDFFKTLDVLVVPEENSLSLKKDPAFKNLKMVFIRHGAGDTHIGFDERQTQFDLNLVAGEKIQNRLTEEVGVPPESIAITGYPKFDVLNQQQHETVFDNNNPTVLYNPHFRKCWSSYQTWGRDILEFFRKNPQYNLILAPHVILYLRKWRHGAFSVDKYKKYPNIHIDKGSSKSIDMTYIRQADIYLGDVSSQAYEFLTTPRPCIFLNVHKLDWRKKNFLNFWAGGRVLEDISELENALQTAEKDHKEKYKKPQLTLFNETFSLTDTPSSHRAADAIMKHFGPNKALADKKSA